MNKTAMTAKIFNSASVPPEECVFCKIVGRKLPSKIVYEDDNYIAFLDKSPYSEGHTLVCPKAHGETVWDMDKEEIGGLFALAARISKAILLSVEADGFRFVQNNGEAANQVVPHVHIHTIPVKMSQKGKWMDRLSVPQERMNEIAESIRQNLEKVPD